MTEENVTEYETGYSVKKFVNQEDKEIVLEVSDSWGLGTMELRFNLEQAIEVNRALTAFLKDVFDDQ